jgi:hypothetical protein
MTFPKVSWNTCSVIGSSQPLISASSCGLKGASAAALSCFSSDHTRDLYNMLRNLNYLKFLAVMVQFPNRTLHLRNMIYPKIKPQDSRKQDPTTNMSPDGDLGNAEEGLVAQCNGQQVGQRALVAGSQPSTEIRGKSQDIIDIASSAHKAIPPIGAQDGHQS